MKKIRACMAIFVGVFVGVLGVAHAHEVYVLSPSEITFALNAPTPDFLATIWSHLGQFLVWGLITLLAVVGVFFVSINGLLERTLDPLLDRLKHLAPFITQVTLGVSLVASGYYHAIFGVELPLPAVFGASAQYMAVILIAIGSMLVLGILPRIVAVVTIVIFGILVGRYGIYMLNYGTYLGEALTVVLFGGAYHLIEGRHFGEWIAAFEQRIAPHLYEYKFLIIRVLFGASLIYASLYAKFFHGALALETVSKYHLTNYFHFDPVFLVLGAMAIEVLLGLFFLLGFEIRFASIFFLIFLTMSLVFFGEAVWPHCILIGTAMAMFVDGYDRYSISTTLNKRRQLDPVL